MTKTTTQSQITREGKAARKTLPKPAKNTKKEKLISLLNKNTGSDITDISKRLGWLPHTTRAALTRLRQAGYEISSEKSGKAKASKYRITGAPKKQDAR